MNPKEIREAAERGEAGAQYRLGWMYELGDEVEPDIEEAVKWFRQAAEKDDADAQNKLGRMYEEGLGVERNGKEAAKWYRKSACPDARVWPRRGTGFQRGQEIVP